MKYWTFFVDETGNFDDLEAVVSVCGILVAQHVPGTGLELEKRLRCLAPFLPWPLHAAHENRPIHFALSLFLAWERMTTGPFLGRPTNSLSDADFGLLEQVGEHRTEKIVANLRQGRPLDSHQAWDLVSNVEYFQQNPRCPAKERERANALLVTLRDLFERLATWEFLCQGRGGALWGAVQTVLDYVGRENSEKLDTTLQSMRQGKRANWQNIADLDGLVRNMEKRSKESQSYLVLKSAQREHRANLKRVLQSLSRSKRPDLVWFAASESEIGDAVLGFEETDRYLTLLGVLLERLRDTLSLLDGEHQVKLRVLGRRVFEKGKTQHLNRHLIADLATQVLDGHSKVHFQAMYCPQYRPGVHPMLVVADYAANRTYGFLQPRDRPDGTSGPELRQIESNVRRELYAEPRSGPDGQERPHLCASGIAHDFQCGAKVDMTYATVWAQAQAKEWTP
ncbi:MAG: hypothetical protein HN348_19040 [Proteobacteria bacterium]|nr:hypothetical protein [Pseudomonadota bacterium]